MLNEENKEEENAKELNFKNATFGGAMTTDSKETNENQIFALDSSAREMRSATESMQFVVLDE